MEGVVSSKGGVYWENIVFLAVTHILGALGAAYCFTAGFSVWTGVLAAVWFLLCALSISSGYHRLFSHRTYRCASLVRIVYLLFGAASFQQSVIRWASDHRTHHAMTDEDGDPHNIRRGFWWAHMGWLFFRTSPPDLAGVRDLSSDPAILFQDKHYLSLALFFGFLAPTLVASLWGDSIGGFLVAGFLRLLVQDHATFSINSVAHRFGSQPYSTSTSAKDCFVASILTMGEGYHNYHHRFPADYRNGIRAYHFDPSKWAIWILSRLGMAWDLKRVPREMADRAAKYVSSGS